MVRIPRSEQTTSVQTATMPVSTGGGYAAPGHALERLGREVQQLGGNLASADDHQSDYDAKMIATNATNEMQMSRIHTQNNYGGGWDGYEGTRGSELDTIVARTKEQLAALPQKSQQRVMPHIIGAYGNEREAAARHGYGLRDSERISWTNNAIESQAKKITAADIDTPSEQIPGGTKLDEHLKYFNLIIEDKGSPIPEAKKGVFRQLAAKHVMAAI
jgi:hypothetical protein